MRSLARRRRLEAAAATSPLAVPRLPGTAHVSTLGNGLTVCRLDNRAAPVVTSALFYRAGTRDEAPGQAGIAHFLEHLMFKGSARYGPGEIDRRTQALGGSNNAFTGHDLTGYYFDFAPDRWREALAIEADRMAGLTLDPLEVASERQVVLEEISMYEGDPWDALELAVHRALFAPHPYGRPVLGTRGDLKAVGPAELAAFHARWYAPANAVLVVAGEVGEAALDQVEEAFGGLPGGPPPRRPEVEPPAPLSGLTRIERRHGDVARLLLAMPGPAGAALDHPAARLLVCLAGGGRASRLHRALVDEGQLCSWVSVELSESLQPGFIAVAAELVAGAEPGEVERVLLAELARLRREPPSGEELERCRRTLAADWVFGHERVHQQALAAGTALTLFDLEHPERQLARLLALPAESLPEVAGRYFDPARSAVLGWSLPSAAGEASGDLEGEDA